MSVNLSHRLRGEELGSSSVKKIVSCDDLFVDELLDLSQENVFESKKCGGGGEEDKEHKSYATVSISPHEPEDSKNPNESFSVTDRFGCLPMTELNVPIDDLRELEWLSSFVDDSFCEFDAPFPAGIWTGKKTQNQLEKETKTSTASTPQLSFKNVFHVKAKSKRVRIGSRVWGDGDVVPFLKKIVCQNTKPSPAKSKIKSSVNVYGGSGTTQTKWRCSHCAVQETPLVRVSLIGSKTLCNACGIRYKSGRLLPEYRPASSPTFTSELYSNYHLKVLEMRQKKTNSELPEHGFTPMVVDSIL